MLETLIKNTLLSLNKIDNELISVADLDKDDKEKFSLIKKAFDDLNSLIDISDKI